jgi:glucose-6-phosphate 1-dehydrogenase
MRRRRHIQLPEGSAPFCDTEEERFDIEPFTMVIFGGTGDLSRRKLIPTLYHIFKEGIMPGDFSIIGFASSRMSDEGFRDWLKGFIMQYAGDEFEEGVWQDFSTHIFYIDGDLKEGGSYRRLIERLDGIAGAGRPVSLIHYMAVPPRLFEPIIKNLSGWGLCKGRYDTRIIVEKPFGRDRDSAIELNNLMLSAFDEEQIYRIDHYLGKETVQNIIFFRFANSIFEPLWNRKYIDHVQITVSETIGIGTRGRFYEEIGVIRDIVQNHMLQLLALVAMEPPAGFDADLIRDEKVKVFRAIRPMDEGYIKGSTVIGQYGPGEVNGERVRGYREEDGVSPDSTTPTFFAGKFFVDNWRWADVPFYLRTGKRLARRVTEISIHFKQPPLRLFSSSCEFIEPNMLVLGIQPDEEISLRFGVKYPSSLSQIYPVTMDFNYKRTFKRGIHPPYERLLIDCMRGDQTLFARQDGVEAMWSVVDPIIKAWEGIGMNDLPLYPAGTWGPPEAEALITNDGRQWRRL